MNKRLNVGPDIVRDSFLVPPRIDRHPSRRLVPHTLEKTTDPRLQRLFLIALGTVAAARSRLLRRKIKEECEIWRGKLDIGRAAPRKGEALRCGKSYAGERIAVAEDGRARCELRLERARSFPSVRGEEQVHGAVV